MRWSMYAALLAVAFAVTYPTPPRIKQTQNFADARALSSKFAAATGPKKRVAVIGGGLSGLACAKYLADAGHTADVFEARNVLGGKVSAWQDKDGDWIETGLHIFFGAYPNMMSLFEELNIEDRLQWKDHKMTFAMQELPGEFTSFDFPPNVPAPFNMAAAILTNTKMLTLEEKIKMVPGLLPMLLEGQSFIDAQDELSVLQFMRKYGMPELINDEIFIAMGKALDFIDPDKLSVRQSVPIPRHLGHTLSSLSLCPPCTRANPRFVGSKRPSADDGGAHRDEPFHQRGGRLPDSIPRWQPAGSAVCSDGAAH
jgi:15-cis-phytoene desaturase